MLRNYSRVSAVAQRNFACAQLVGSRALWAQFSPTQKYTKYRITRPDLGANSAWEDVQIAQPDSETLMKFNKDVPVFLRFLKLVTDKEGRNKDFVDFAKRCENGLVVQEGAYITKSELLANMDKNGYSTSEITAFSLAFPDDYKFHYPELAVAFDLSEEDAFKYAMRTRMENQEITHVKYDKTPGFLGTFFAAYLPVAFILANPWSVTNYAFTGKIVPYYITIAALYKNFGEEVLAQFRQANNDYAKQNAKVVLEGQEQLLRKTAKFAADTDAVQHLADFKPALDKKLAAYRAALVAEHKKKVSDRVERQLVSLRNAEREVATGLQELMAKEILGAFRAQYNEKAQGAALTSAIASISGEKAQDPVRDFVLKSLAEFQAADLNKIKGNPSGTVVERVAFAYQQREQALLNNFTVKAEEAKAVKALVPGGDVSKLDAAALEQLDKVYRELNERVGFATLTEAQLAPLAVPASLEGEAQTLVASTKAAVEEQARKIRTARLQNFVSKF